MKTPEARVTVATCLLAIMLLTWALVWQAGVIQQQKKVIRQLSGMTFSS